EFIQNEMIENPTIELVEGKDSSEEGEEGEGSDASEPPAGGETATGAEGIEGAEGGEAPAGATETGNSTEGTDGADVLETVLEDAEPIDPPADELREEFDRIAEVEFAWSEVRRGGGGGLTPDGKDRKLEAMNNTAARAASLQDYLYEQLSMLDISEREREIGEHLIYNIDDTTGWLGYHDDKGKFHPHALEDLVQSMDEPCSVEEAERVLEIIQSLDPPGVGARGLEECLLLQMRDAKGPEAELARRIVERHFEDLKKNRLPKIRRALEVPLEAVKDAVAFIASLNPYPGASFSSREPRRIIPDLECELVDGRYEVRLLDEYIPRVRISKHYRDMFEQQGDNPAVREYLKKKIESAKWLMDAIEQRRSTLLRIAKEIVDYQSDFLDRGIDALKPLKMQYVADRVGVHVSTVSRAISQKYIQTPRGVLPLRFFFTGGTTNADGESESVLALKQKVKDVIEQEDKHHPLSDEDVAHKLREMGYQIARRTVTKYRKQLGIPSSRQRRQY
ncbi:MAG: RNA polymerase sigma-54 factor, partial [Planctomycetota bacterium]